MIPPALLFFLKIALAIQGLLLFHRNFRIVVSISMKNVFGILIETVDCFGEYGFFLILFIYFWLRWVFVAARGLSLVAASGGYSSLPCTGFCLPWLLLLRSTGSRCVGSVVVARGLSSCGAWA